MVQILKHYPATSTLLMLLCVMTLLYTSTSNWLTQNQLTAFGFSPLAMAEYQFWRIFSSLFVTAKLSDFMLAILMISIAGAGVEYYCGSLTVLVTFFGVHICALLVMSLVCLWLYPFNIAPISLIVESIDVGPSAGYFGMLGFLCAYHRQQYWLIGVIIFAVLIMVLLSEPQSVDRGMIYSANLVHLIAFPLGFVYGCMNSHQ